MPFKSEAQRRYLWANEPEIARDWTDTYGSKIHAADGGIMRLPFAEGDIVDDRGHTYETSRYGNEYDDEYITEDEFNEMFGEETSGIDTLKDKVIGGKDWLMSALGAALDAPGIGLVMRGLQGPQLTQAQKNMNNQFFQNYNVGIGTQQNPFQMTSGPFAGMNAPGMSAYGSPTSQAMAQKWLERYGAVDHYSDAMKQKKQTMIDLVGSGQQDVSAPNYPGANQGNNMGMTQGGGHKAPGGSGYGPHSSGGAHGGKNYGPYSKAKGGLISLWPR